LIIDEASMMVFPHFLALSTLVSLQGEIMLTGDHRQLAPIVSHDWENEDRPPVVVYRPFKSAYEAIRDIARRNISSDSVRVSALSFTFRLPPPLVELISRLYRLDDIVLQGLPREMRIVDASSNGGSWNRIWQGDFGLFLVLHSERQSQRHNRLEAEIIRQIVEARMPHANDSIAVVTPHRAQRNLLKEILHQHYGGPIGIIDTVERLQGGQRPTVILSATESDPCYISSNVGFILDLNRSNVAFSRSEDRLIVVCSEALMNHIPAEYEQYESTMLWKALRNVCSRLVANIDMQGTRVRIFTFEPPAAVGA
jgi:superfamily I DNA and/or RNA helicase